MHNNSVGSRPRIVSQILHVINIIAGNRKRYIEKHIAQEKKIYTHHEKGMKKNAFLRPLTVIWNVLWISKKKIALIK